MPEESAKRGSAEDADPLVALVRQKADELRRNCLIPPDLEARLDAHAEAIAGRPEASGKRLREAIQSIKAGPPPSLAVRNRATRVIAGPMLLLINRVDQLAASVRRALEVVAEALDDPDGHRHAALERQVDQLLDRVAQLDRLPEGQDALVDLRRRVEDLEAAVREVNDRSKNRQE